jgi:pimeloyl-ACP methyl ester carboxylesterase
MKAVFAEDFMSGEEHELERERWRVHIQDIDSNGALRTLRGIVLGAGSVTDQLADVGLPVLAVAGVEDKSFSPDQVQKMALRIPDAEYAEIAGAGHAVAIEQPEETGQRIRDFLDRVSAGRTTTCSPRPDDTTARSRVGADDQASPAIHGGSKR